MPIEITVASPGITISQGRTFMVTDQRGEINPYSDEGVYAIDTRFLDTYHLFINHVPWELVNASQLSFYAERVHLTNPAIRTTAGSIAAHTLGLTINRTVGEGIHEDFELMSTQTILVTGSSSGFGFWLTQRLLTQGYTVFATMRHLAGPNTEKAAQLRHFAQNQQGTLHLLELDVTDETSVGAAVEKALQQAGRLDVVINNAGIGGGGYTEAFSVAQFQQIFDINVFGIQRVMRAVLPSMRAQRSGLIVNVSSLQGRIVIPFAGAYTASKFAVEGLTESYHYELAPLGVDVVIVEPGGFLTGYWSKMMNPADQTRVSGYAPADELPDQLWNGVIGSLQSDQAPDPQVLVSAVIQLIETPAGKRPLRTVVDPMMGGAAPTAVNQTYDIFPMTETILGEYTSTMNERLAIRA